MFTSYNVALGNDPSLTAAQLELEGTAAYAVGREDLARYDAYHERNARIAAASRNATGAAVNVAQVGVIGATSTNPVSLPQNQNDEGHLQEGNAGGSAERNGASPSNV